MNQYRDEEEIKHVIAQYSPKELGILNRMQEKVDELGKNLSLGERQLLVLIRIML
jgi:ABC-type multidrug transport system fused ATPase/permease subunit